MSTTNVYKCLLQAETLVTNSNEIKIKFETDETDEVCAETAGTRWREWGVDAGRGSKSQFI